MDETRRHAVLLNPSAGGGSAAKMRPRVEAAMRANALDFHIVETTGLEHGGEAAVAAAEEGEVPVIVSGDGLIGYAGGELAGMDVPIGIVPGGRGNDLARVLGIPTDVEGAVEVVAAGTERAIDIGEANGRRFICIASCGFDSDANRIANEAKLVRGPLVYAYAALRALAAWRPANFTVTVDGESRSFAGYTVAAANSKAYGGGMFVAPDAELDDGLLDVVLSGDVSKWRFLRGIPEVFRGEHVEQDSVEVLRGAEVTIAADRDFDVYADGERITALPATVRLLPRALRVIAPSAAGATP